MVKTMTIAVTVVVTAANQPELESELHCSPYVQLGHTRSIDACLGNSLTLFTQRIMLGLALKTIDFTGVSSINLNMR